MIAVDLAKMFAPLDHPIQKMGDREAAIEAARWIVDGEIFHKDGENEKKCDNGYAQRSLL